MKNLLIKKTFLLATLLGAFSMISCSDDGEGDPIAPAPNTTVKNVSMDYSVDLASTYYAYFDVTVEYTHEDGQVKQETINGNWDYSYTKSYEEVPENIVCKVAITPKNPLPDIEEEYYRVDANIVANVAGYTKEGVQNKNFGWNGRYSAGGEKTTEELKIYTSKSHNLLNFSYTKGSPNP